MMIRIIRRRIYALLVLLVLAVFFPSLNTSARNIEIPIGMNLPALNYYTPSLVFSDAMTTASPMMTFPDWKTMFGRT